MKFTAKIPCIAALVVAGALGGCSSTLKAVPLNEAGRFDTPNRMTAAEVTVNRPFDKARDGKMVYVDTKSAANLGSAAPALRRFFVDSVTNAKAFDTVYDSDGLQKMVIAKGKDADFNDNLVGLHKLAQEIGPFLIIQPTVEWKGGYNFEADLKVIDASNAQTVFQAHRKAFNWAGLDKPLFYPMFNALLDWTQGVAPPVTVAAAEPANKAQR